MWLKCCFSLRVAQPIIKWFVGAVWIEGPVHQYCMNYVGISSFLHYLSLARWVRWLWIHLQLRHTDICAWSGHLGAGVHSCGWGHGGPSASRQFGSAVSSGVRHLISHPLSSSYLSEAERIWETPKLWERAGNILCPSGDADTNIFTTHLSCFQCKCKNYNNCEN